jgi:hypothetical protein
MRSLVLFLGRYSFGIALAAMVGSLSAYFFIETEDASIGFVFRRHGLPFVAVIVAAALFYRRDLRAQCDTDAKYWASLVAVALFTSISAPGWLLWANAVFPPQEHFILKGTVEGKKVTRYKNAAKSWVMISGYPEYILVADLAYSRVEVGDPFGQLRYRGPLGFSYVWSADWPANQSPNPLLPWDAAPKATASPR